MTLLIWRLDKFVAPAVDERMTANALATSEGDCRECPTSSPDVQTGIGTEISQ